MNYLYILLIVSAGVFVMSAVTAQIRLNMHTDMQAKFLIAAKAYNFSPLKSMSKRTAKYFLFSAVLLLICLGGTAVISGITGRAVPDLVLTAAVFGASLAAYAANSALILLCASVYVRHKMRYTPIL